MRSILANPLRLRRGAVGLVLAAAVLAAVAVVLRDRAAADRGRITYLLDAAAWLVATFGAAAEARVSAVMFPARPQAVRRRALMLFAVGTSALLVGCVVLSFGQDGLDAMLPRAGAAGVLVAGFGAGLGGLLTLAWVYGGAYAADRIAEFDEDR